MAATLDSSFSLRPGVRVTMVGTVWSFGARAAEPPARQAPGRRRYWMLRRQGRPESSL